MKIELNCPRNIKHFYLTKSCKFHFMPLIEKAILNYRGVLLSGPYCKFWNATQTATNQNSPFYRRAGQPYNNVFYCKLLNFERGCNTLFSKLWRTNFRWLNFLQSSVTVRYLHLNHAVYTEGFRKGLLPDRFYETHVKTLTFLSSPNFRGHLCEFISITCLKQANWLLTHSYLVFLYGNKTMARVVRWHDR